MLPDLEPLIVSAPFGNYVGHGWSTPTLGSFTLHPRPPGSPDNPVRGGRLWRVLRTVRYNPFTRAWRNKIGLRNPGIDSVNVRADSSKAQRIRDSIISVHGFTADEWPVLIERAAKTHPRAIEINLSCPNVTDDTSPFDVIDVAVHAPAQHVPLIAKLPPWGYGCAELAEYAYKRGIRCFHACNTIPSPKGGISGKPLHPLSLQAVAALRDAYPDARIIGGGGVTAYADAARFVAAGANHVAVASCLFFPWNLLRMRLVARRLRRNAHATA